MTTEVVRGAFRRGLLVISASCLFLGPVVAAGLHAASPACLFGQSAAPAPKNDYAFIYGTVWGAGDRPAPGIPVTIRRVSGKKTKWELVSDSRGEFAQRVPAGGQDYLIQADVKVAKGQPKPEITVHIDDNERKDVSLHLTK